MSAAEAIFDEIDTPIGGVPAEGVMLVWDRVEPLLRRVLKPVTGVTTDAVLTELQLAKMQLWVIGDFEAVAITSVNVRPLHKVLWVQYVAGDNMKNWLDDFIQVVESFAEHNDCVAVEFSGRQGWLRHLARDHAEYKPILTTMRRELTDGR